MVLQAVHSNCTDDVLVHRLLLVQSFAVCLRWFRDVLEIMLLDFNIDSDNETLIFLYFAFKDVVRSPD